MKTLIRALLFYGILMPGLSAQSNPEIEKLQADFAAATVDSVKFQLLDKLARLSIYVDMAKSRHFSEELIRLADAAGDQLWSANGRNNFSKAILGQGKIDSAILVSQDAIVRYEVLGNQRMKNAAMMNLSVMFCRQGNNEKGLEILFKLVDAIPTFNNPATVTSIYGNIASIYVDMGETDKADKFNRKALEWAKKAPKKQKVADILSSMAQNLAQRRDSTDAAIRLLEEAISIQLTEKTCLSCLGRDHLLLSELFLSKKEMGVAITKAIKAADFSRQSGEKLLSFQTASHAARLLSANGQLKDAGELLQEAEKIRPTIQSPELMAKFHEARAEFEFGMGNRGAAFDNRQLAWNFQDSAHRQRYSERVSKVGLQNDLKLQARETEFFKKQNDSLAEKNRLFLLLAGLLSLFLIGGGIVFQRIRRQKKIIENQNAELETLNATKDKFFAIIAHDLRGPIISFHGLIKKINWLVARGEIDRVNQLGSSVDEAAAGLGKLLDNLLSWALIQRGMMPYNPEAIMLREEAEAVVNIFRNSLDARHIAIKIDVPEGLAVSADRNALACILRNLTDNAAKYTPEGSRIRISATQTNGTVSLSVRDNGPGMSREQVEQLFSIKKEEKLSRATGTGLGLMLCKELTELNRGSLEVETREAEGTTISIHLPSAN